MELGMEIEKSGGAREAGADRGSWGSGRGEPEKASARVGFRYWWVTGPRRRWACLARLLGSLLPLSYSLETENNKEEKEKKGGVGEEIGHADNFPGPTRMCLFQENRKGHG